MKLNVNAKELVALHNMLHEKFSQHGQEFAADDPRGADESQLRQVYNRVRACIISSLSEKQPDPLDVFLAQEQAKIDKLKDQNEEIKKEQLGLVAAIKDPDFFVAQDDGEEYQVPEYPRRGPRNQGGKRGGNKR